MTNVPQTPLFSLTAMREQTDFLVPKNCMLEVPLERQ
jgi:hypothetical protein